MGEMIRMTMDDGAEIAVYHAQPAGERPQDRKGGLVLVQEIFGVTDHIRELCDEYAEDGYEVLSPRRCSTASIRGSRATIRGRSSNARCSWRASCTRSSRA